MSDPSTFGRLYAGNAVTELSGVVWSGGTWALPLSHLADDRITAFPARCVLTGVDETDRARAQFVVDFGAVINVWGVLIEHFSGADGAEVKVTKAMDAGFSQDVVTSGWAKWNRRTYDSIDLPWYGSAADWWTGTPSAQELDTWGRRAWVSSGEAPWTGRYLRIEIAPHVAAPVDLDLGYLFVPTKRWRPDRNHALGRDMTPGARDIVEETPSGYRVVDMRRPRRRHTIPYEVMSKTAAMDLAGIGAQAGQSKPVLFLPEPGDPLNAYRDTFLGQFVGLPGARQWQQTLWAPTSSLVIEEMLG